LGCITSVSDSRPSTFSISAVFTFIISKLKKPDTRAGFQHSYIIEDKVNPCGILACSPQGLQRKAINGLTITNLFHVDKERVRRLSFLFIFC
jgi:hypothetical protein